MNTRRANVAALLGSITALFAGTALADTAAGVAAYNAGEFAKAEALLDPPAQAGDAEAQFRLGQLYADGPDDFRDLSGAIDWFRRAADSGHAEAQFQLGMRYSVGMGTDRDLIQAYKWLRLAERNLGTSAPATFLDTFVSKMAEDDVAAGDAAVDAWIASHTEESEPVEVVAEPEPSEVAATDPDPPRVVTEPELPQVAIAEPEPSEVAATDQDPPGVVVVQPELPQAAIDEPEPSEAASDQDPPGVVVVQPGLPQAAIDEPEPSEAASDQDPPGVVVVQPGLPQAAIDEPEPSEAASDQDPPGVVVVQPELPQAAIAEPKPPKVAATDQDPPRVVVVEPEPSVVTVTDPNRPEVAAVQPKAPATPTIEAIFGVIDRLECADLRPSIAADGRVRIVGVIPEEKDVEDLLAEWEVAFGSTPVDLSIDQVGELNCSVAALVRPLRPDRPLLKGVSGGSPAIAEDELVVVEINPGEASGFLYVDYFQLDGTVIHLLPEAVDGPERVEAGRTLRLGDGTASSFVWRAAPPFGRELIAAFISAQPLFSTPRRVEEPAAEYLLSLDALVSQSDVDLWADYVIITTKPR